MTIQSMVIKPFNNPQIQSPSSSKETKNFTKKVNNSVAPFPYRLKNKEKTTQFDKILDILKHIHANLPLFDTIEQIAQYGKCLEELCTLKRATNIPKIRFSSHSTPAC